MSLKNFLNNKKGDSGIGTLIVFIAMVLVAAVAASVLINTSGFLQQKASTTGKESTEQVASGLQILQIVGQHNTTNVNNTAIYVTPNAGSGAIDLSQAVVMFSDGSVTSVFRYGVGNYTNISTTGGDVFTSTYDAWDAGSGEFGIIVIQDADTSCKEATPVINKGDIVVITLDTSSMNMGSRKVISGKVQPEFGAPGIISFTTPSTYLSEQTIVQLQ